MDKAGRNQIRSSEAVVTATPHFYHRIRDIEGQATLDLSGDLNELTAARVRAVLGKALMDRGHVVAVVSGLTLRWPAALALFPASLAQAGGWPLARLVLLGADPELTVALHAAQIDKSVGLADTWQDAKALLRERPERLRRDVRLPSTAEAARLARIATDETCRDWELEVLSLEAQMVATELVINAVEHARTENTLALTLTRTGLHIAVRDWAPISEAQLRPFTDSSGPGRGLVLVSGLTMHWGVTRHFDGKTVWAVLGTGARHRARG